jgi:putative ABC transport system ATP-binding protein
MPTPQSPQPAVRLRGVTKHFGQGAARVQALRGIDMDVMPGELMMLVGPSGCGKTTLISVVAGILNRDEGEMALFGRDFSTMKSGERTTFRGNNIGFVFQAYNLIPALTAAQNAAVPLMIQGMGRRDAEKKARVWLERVGFDERMMKACPSQLSGGQQQRVAIARALIHDPRLIVCDEPTAALDHDTGQKVLGLLREVALHDGRALIVVTHDARIFPYADRIARMDDGRIESIQTPEASATPAH